MLILPVKVDYYWCSIFKLILLFLFSDKYGRSTPRHESVPAHCGVSCLLSCPFQRDVGQGRRQPQNRNDNELNNMTLFYFRSHVVVTSDVIVPNTEFAVLIELDQLKTPEDPNLHISIEIQDLLRFQDVWTLDLKQTRPCQHFVTSSRRS